MAQDDVQQGLSAEHWAPAMSLHVEPSQHGSVPLQSLDPQSHCSPASMTLLPHVLVSGGGGDGTASGGFTMLVGVPSSAESDTHWEPLPLPSPPSQTLV